MSPGYLGVVAFSFAAVVDIGSPRACRMNEGDAIKDTKFLAREEGTTRCSESIPIMLSRDHFQSQCSRPPSFKVIARATF